MILCVLIMTSAISCGSSSVDEFIQSGDFTEGVMLLVAADIIPWPGWQFSTMQILNEQELIEAGTGLYNFGAVSLGGTKTVVFTIVNQSRRTLNLTGDPAISITGASPESFFVSSEPAEKIIPAGGAQTFSVTFDPDNNDPATATVEIPNDSDKIPVYIFSLTGTGTQQPLAHMAVYQAETQVPSGGTEFDFGTIAANAVKHVTFRVTNTGTANLLILQSNLLLLDTGDTQCETNNAGIRFRNENEGVRSYAFFPCYTCDCPGVSTSSYENIAFSQSGPYNCGGGNYPGLIDGSSCSSSTNTSNLNFTSGNLYTVTDTPGGFQISHDGAGQFTMAVEPPSLIAANNGYGDFTISFKPTVAGRHTATVEISNNSVDEPVYTFTITGTVTSPQVSLFQGAVNISSGSELLNFERVELNATKNVFFRIVNNGSTVVTLTNESSPVHITGGDGQFTVSTQPVSPIPANGGYRDFTISFNPASLGVKTASVTIANDTTDTPLLTFNLNGIGVQTVPAWINNGLDEPLVSSATNLYLTIQWPEITNANKYELYHFTAPDCSDEVKFTDTGGTIATIPSTYKNIRVKALSYSSAIMDTWVVRGDITAMPRQFGSGLCDDDFEDGIISTAYVINNPAQASESNGYLQLNLNGAGNEPEMYFGYDPEGKRYVHLSMKWFQHRESDAFYGNTTSYSYLNNLDSVTWGNYYDGTLSNIGTYIMHSEYDPHTYQPDYTATQLGTDVYFDEWFDWDVYIDTVTGTYRAAINGTEFASYDTGFYYGYILIFRISPGGEGTGHFIRIDDLLIESSDMPY